MAEIISAVYKIINTITGDFYIGSSKDVKQRWRAHKKPSVWKNHPNNQMYIDMQKYGLDNFDFQILEEVEPDSLKEKEQYFIETLKPTYNQMNAKGLNIVRRKDYQKEYSKEYEKSDKRKKAKKEYEKTDKRKKYKKEYYNQLCFYNGETITLDTLRHLFSRSGIEHPVKEAKKYLVL